MNKIDEIIRYKIFDDNWTWSAENNEFVKQLVREKAGLMIDVTESSQKEDMNECTDFKIIPNGTLGSRIRRPGYKRFGDFTIRTYLPSGKKTEIDKIVRDNISYYIYVWTKYNEFHKIVVESFILVDIDKARKDGVFDKWQSKYKEITNTDKTRFIGISLDILKPYLL